MSSSTEKVRENRARRAVERRGYALEKSRRRDPDAWDYGTYQIVDYSNGPGGQLVYADWDTGQGWGLTLDDVEEWLGQDGGQPVNDQRAGQAERAAQIRRIAERVIPRGHWTEYGDVSQLVYGHRRGGPAIGQTMLRRADFPKAHRILGEHGQIPAGWRHTDGSGGPADCADALRDEGIMVLTRDDGALFADPVRYIGADRLARRLGR
jgi:alkylated DNA nucleotide flippase Atl1